MLHPKILQIRPLPIDKEEQYIALEKYKTTSFETDVDYLFRTFVEPWLDKDEQIFDMEMTILLEFIQNITKSTCGKEFHDNTGSTYYIMNSYD